MADSGWSGLAAGLKAALDDGLNVSGTVDEAEVRTHVGQVGIDLLIEVSDLEGSAQTAAYGVLCDLLDDRLAGGSGQALGFMIFATEPDPGALAGALDQMIRTDGRASFTPVVPLSPPQARAVSESASPLDRFMDSAAALVAAAADHRPPTLEVAETLLAELDELIDRHLDA